MSVLPEPVLALTSTSAPAIASGSASRWIDVGEVIDWRASAAARSGRTRPVNVRRRLRSIAQLAAL